MTSLKVALFSNLLPICLFAVCSLTQRQHFLHLFQIKMLPVARWGYSLLFPRKKTFIIKPPKEALAFINRQPRRTAKYAQHFCKKKWAGRLCVSAPGEMMCAHLVLCTVYLLTAICTGTVRVTCKGTIRLFSILMFINLLCPSNWINK